MAQTSEQVQSHYSETYGHASNCCLPIHDATGNAAHPGTCQKLPEEDVVSCDVAFRTGTRPPALPMAQAKSSSIMTISMGAQNFSTTRSISIPRTMMATWSSQKSAKQPRWLTDMSRKGSGWLAAATSDGCA
mmetsp:Transcript_5840/g.21298  ORF Transcript_5840/g.21298 Transcript_5840/m.21298 type:complete len:132 (-) Transcript_5840:727-1122(-)